jgi:hypothetical protein
MALPKLETPTYELSLPSTNEKIKYRPFLVKEQKILYMSQNSDDEGAISDAVSSLVASCTFGSVNPSVAPMFDIEYIFLQIRSKSVGETIEVSVTCPDDKKTKVPVKIKLDEVDVQMTTGHTNEVMLSDKLKLVLRYPLLKDMKSISGISNIDKSFKILSNCIYEIHDGDKVYNTVDVTNEEINTFIEQMTTGQIQKVMEFFETMPKLRHVVKVTNPKTKVKSEVVVEGLPSFLG